MCNRTKLLVEEAFSFRSKFIGYRVSVNDNHHVIVFDDQLKMNGFRAGDKFVLSLGESINYKTVFNSEMNNDISFNDGFEELENMEESSGSSSNFYSPDIKIQGDASHAHFYKDVSHLQKIDVYRVLELYNVTHPCIQHAVKKLLCAGCRGAKDFERDLREAIDSITRALDMIAEDECKD